MFVAPGELQSISKHVKLHNLRMFTKRFHPNSMLLDEDALAIRKLAHLKLHSC